MTTTHRATALTRAATAVLLLVALSIGVPALLVIVAGNPLPEHLPAIGELTGQLRVGPTPGMLTGAIAIIGWLGWASWIIPVLLEVPAHLKGVRAPQLPGLGAQQRLAAVLLASITLAGTATAASASTASAHPTSPARAVSTTAPAAVTPSAHPSSAHQGQTTYTVRAGDTLWDIAATHLGNGDRYPEIAALNYQRPQPGGHHLTHDHVLQPGWTLTLPATHTATGHQCGTTYTATGHQCGTTYTVQHGDTLAGIAATHLGDRDQWPTIAHASRHLAQPDGHHLTDPDHIQPGWTLLIPTTAAATITTTPTPAAPHHTKPTPQIAAPPVTPPAAPAPKPTPSITPATPQPPASNTPATPQPPASNTPATAPSTATDPDITTPTASNAATTTASTSDQDHDVRTAGGFSALAAAAALAALGLRRRRQSRARRPGQRLPMPTGPAATHEAELRAVADPLATEDVDRALRHIAEHHHTTSTPVPPLRAARVSPDTLELYYDQTPTPIDLPAPFTSTDDPGVWLLHRTELHQLPTAALLAATPAPYPALTTIGQDTEDAHLLLDLEQLGALTITSNDPDTAREAITALAVELTVSVWADDLQVTLVGLCPELPAALGHDRATYTDTLDSALTSLTYGFDIQRRAMTTAQVTTPAEARARQVVPDAWAPHLLLLAEPPTPTQAAQLAEALADRPRVAVAVVTTVPRTDGPLPEGLSPWVLTIRDDDATLDPAGIDIRPQRLDAASYDAIIAQLTLTQADCVPGPAWAQDATTEHDSLDDLPLLTQEPTEDAPAASQATDDLKDDDAASRVAAEEQLQPTVDALPLNDSPADDQPTALPHVLAHLTTPATPSDLPAEEARTAGEPAAAGETLDKPAAPGTDLGAQPPAPVPAPRVLVLGPLTVDGATGPTPPSPKKALERVAFLALHPHPTHEPYSEAMAPGRPMNANTRNSDIRKLRVWLGDSPDGRPYVSLIDDGGYGLHPDVRTDWQDFQDLLGPSIATTPTAQLSDALRLVRGQPFAGTPGDRYAWAEPDRQEMIATIADVAHEVATRALTSGDARTATWAATIGLQVEPASEALWRAQLRAAWLTGDPNALQRTITALHTQADALGGDLEDTTQELLDELTHRTRHG